MMVQLKAIPFLEPYPSHANFILAKVRVVCRLQGLFPGKIYFLLNILGILTQISQFYVPS
jgi:hypothetical protein